MNELNFEDFLRAGLRARPIVAAGDLARRAMQMARAKEAVERLQKLGRAWGTMSIAAAVAMIAVVGWCLARLSSGSGLFSSFGLSTDADSTSNAAVTTATNTGLSTGVLGLVLLGAVMVVAWVLWGSAEER
ncbi:MAG: hypothetical protein WCI73_09850 [Phycisphaerae bacterium]